MQVLNKTRDFLASAKAKTTAVLAIATAAVTSAPAAFAEDPTPAIIAKVTTSMTSGLEIAGAVVLGIFAIWGVKLLLKGK